MATITIASSGALTEYSGSSIAVTSSGVLVDWRNTGSGTISIASMGLMVDVLYPTGYQSIQGYPEIYFDGKQGQSFISKPGNKR